MKILYYIVCNRIKLKPLIMYEYECRLFNNIEFRANPLLYTIAQYIKTLVDLTMIKIRKEKNNYKMYDSKIKKKNFFKS
jgi:hypothetical protein